jgi:putative tricarboxylic transport membrane protein
MQSHRRRLPGELIFCLALIVFGLFILWQAYRISGFDSISSAGSFPMVAALVMVISAVVALAKTARMPRSEGEPGESLPRQFARRLVPGVLVAFTLAIAAYMVLLDPLGFLVSSYLFLVVSMRLLGSARWVRNLVVSAVALALIYVVFQTVFSVVLPSGTWLQGVLK